MSNVIKFPKGSKADFPNTWLAGFAAGIADAKRNYKAFGEIAFESTIGISKEEFIDAGADKHDLEEIFEE